MNKLKFSIVLYLGLGIIPLVCYLIPNLAALPVFEESMTFLFKYFNYLALISVGILGLKLNQTRILISAGLLTAMYHFSLNPEVFEVTGITTTRYFEIISMAFPLGIALMFLMREMRLLGLNFIYKFLVATIPFLLLAIWISEFNPSYITAVYFHGIQALDSFEVPQIVLLPLIMLITTTVLKRKEKAFPFLISTLIILIPIFTACHIGMDITLPQTGKMALIVLAYTSVAIIYILTIFNMYWQRVYIDELTQIPNRRALDEMLSSLSGKYAIGMMDIDHFKKFNDTFGHDAGDDVLRVVGTAMSDNTKNAKIYRYGGEEFVAVFMGLSAEEAFEYGDTGRDKLAKRDFYIRQDSERDKKDRGKTATSKRTKVQITISMGIAQSGDKGPEEVIKDADKALYSAKEAGRNCVKIKD